MKNFLFTSESVSEGHPDKVSDCISDTIVDLMISKYPYARVACETLVTTNRVILAGEYRLPDGVTITKDEIEENVRLAVKKIGYEQDGFHWEKMNVDCFLHQQSPDIAQGVDETHNKEEGAGDQGLMFGYATDETPSLMPAPIHYSHEILKKLAELRHSGKADFLGPDSKSQLTIEYDNERPIKAHKIVVSSQHKDGFNQTELKDFIMSFVKSILPEKWMCHNDDFYVNPTGRFVIGGPDGDTGLTGRKIIVDTYGGSSPHGGGAFSGKDPTKVDRSAAYMTRYLAKNVVAAKLAKKCTIQIAYGIGISKPLSFYVNTQGTGEIEDLKIQKCLEKIVDLTPKGIRDHLALNNPIYVPSSSYGHFGRQPDEKVKGSFSWEKVDLVEKILNEINMF